MTEDQDWDLWERDQNDLLTIEICNALLHKQGKCGRLCQTCQDWCDELREWLDRPDQIEKKERDRG